MIKDTLANASLYDSVHPRFKGAFRWIAENAKPDAQDGRFQLEGDKLVGLIQHYNTRPFNSKNFEAHKKYIDIQYIISGSEKIHIENLDQMTVSVPFDETKDVGFFEGKGYDVTMNPGDFMIIWPHEAHVPGADASTSSTPIHKIVMKVAL